jgi:alginate O-acetyltransferase complex protein AlgI
MVFSSAIFLFIFLPFSILGFYLIRKEYRNIYLLCISFVFFAWGGSKSIVILLASIIINYIFGLLINWGENQGNLLGRIIFITSILANLILLGYFKYFNFFLNTVNRIGSINLPLQDIILPLGISFFTFSGLSYLIDLYLGTIEVQRNPLNFALYISFFPKLIQGPISRYIDIESQIVNSNCNSTKFADGAFRFVGGLAKKLVIADQLGIVVDQIFANPANQNSVSIAWLGGISYAMQIFFDFSGYTDMAIGLGKMFGIDLMENFNFPYISMSISEFWRRWHISLSSWFRDYVFFPLEFKRRKKKYFRQEYNTLLVFFLTGLWHGAAWHYVIWGLWHGLFISFEIFLKSRKIKIKLPSFIKYLFTMLIVTIGWVIFRSNGLGYAGKYLAVMFGLLKPVNNGITLAWYLTPKIAAVLMIAVLACVPWKQAFPRFTEKIAGSKTEMVLRDVSFVILLVLSIILVMSSSYNSFIYFKF